MIAMPTVTVVAPTAQIRADAAVVGIRSTKDGPRLAAGSEAIDAALGGRLYDAVRALGATGRPDEAVKIPTLGMADFPLVVGTGLGPDEAPSAEAARRAAGAALRTLTGQRRVHFALDAPAGALAEGALLGAYVFNTYKSAATKPALRTITIAAPGDAKAEVKRAVVIAEAVALTRDLVNTPPNDLYPETFAKQAAELAGERGVTVEILDEKALRRAKFGGILAVGQGSVRPPRLVRLTYRPTGSAKSAGTHLALVGKGITFDSGGLNLKTANMTSMKSDMGGAAAVIAAVLAIAALKLPLAVTATVPMAENMPSGSSYRPSDILRMYDGSAVEVGDTDAEGRLVLADAITRAAEDDPDYLIETSTLTGAQMVALGPRLIGAMGAEDWRDEVVAAAHTAGEGIWAMPLPEELRSGLDSPVADLVNVPAERWAGMLVAGRFLAEFVPDGLPWVHLDIAGPSFNNGAPRDYTPKGGTGAGVRTIVAAAERLSGR